MEEDMSVTIIPAQPGFDFRPNWEEEERYAIIAWHITSLASDDVVVRPITVRGLEEAQYGSRGLVLDVDSGVFKDGHLE